MTLSFQKTRTAGFAAAAVLALVSVGSSLVPGYGQENRSSADLAVRELRTALELSRKQLEAEKRKSAKLEAKDQALSASLAESNRLLTGLRTEHEDLMLRMASFGVDLLKPEPGSLEQRLLNSVRERAVVEEEKEKLARQLARLSEATVNFMQRAVTADAASLELIERELEAAGQMLGPAAATRQNDRTLGEAQVVSIDPEIGLVVLNVGKKSGARIGMPIRILRAETLIATALVVDVRDAITGAVLQRLATEGEDVRVGDRIEPEARQF